MATTYITILGILYLLTFILFIIIEILYISKHRSIRAISYLRLMYSLIYGLVPALVYFNNSVYNLDFSDLGIEYLYILYVLAIAGYISINLGYILRISKTCTIHKRVEIKNLYTSGVLLMIVGFVSLLLWTKAFGSPFGIIKYASEIRSGDTPVDNPFTFMKHTSTLLMFASYIFFIFLDDKRYNRLITVIFLLFSVFWSVIYLIANDGRMSFILYFTIFVLYRIILSSSKGSLGRSFLKLAAVALVTFVLMATADYYLNYIKYGSAGDISSDENLTSMVTSELGYTMLSGQTSLQALTEGLSGSNILMDMEAGIFAWIPSSFKPDNLVPLFNYNTMLSGYNNGTLPTDFLSMCIYDLGIFGVFIMSFLLGAIFHRIDSIYESNRDVKYYTILHILSSVWLSLRVVAYADMENIMISMLFILIGSLTVKIMSRIKICNY